MNDPRVRKDGTCAYCRGPRTMPTGRLYREQAERDPFCSRECCVAWRAEQRAKHVA